MNAKAARPHRWRRFSLRADLPLQRDAGARFLPWILGITVYLACLAAAAAIGVEQGAGAWRAQLAQEATVEAPAPAGETEAERKARLDAIMERIAATPGVTSVRLLGREEIEDLLQPWLDEQVLAIVALPDLLALSLAPDVRLDAEELAGRLAEIAPGARVDTHAEFAAQATRFLRGAENSALALLALVLAASLGLVGFVAATGLSIHRRVVEILNLFGADDEYVAKQFQLQTLRFGAPGAIIGTLGAIATLHFGFAWLGRLGALSLGMEISAYQLAAMAAVPLLALAGAHMTARWVVIAALRREG